MLRLSCFGYLFAKNCQIENTGTVSKIRWQNQMPLFYLVTVYNNVYIPYLSIARINFAAYERAQTFFGQFHETFVDSFHGDISGYKA